MTADEEERFDGPCVVCGETVKGTGYVALGLFFVGTAHGDGLHFEPDEDAPLIADWRDVALTRVVHLLTCAQVYFEGVHAEVEHHRRHMPSDGGSA